MCVISNTIQRGWPLFTEDLTITASPVGSPPPSSGSREESIHTAQRQHSMTISTEPGTHTNTHTQLGREAGKQAGRLAVGEYESGTLEMLESTACQLAFSEMWIPFPSHHVFTQAHERPDGLQRVYLIGLGGPGCAHATVPKWQQHLYSLTSQPLRIPLMSSWLVYRLTVDPQTERKLDILSIYGETNK